MWSPIAFKLDTFVSLLPLVYAPHISTYFSVGCLFARNLFFNIFFFGVWKDLFLLIEVLIFISMFYFIFHVFCLDMFWATLEALSHLVAVKRPLYVISFVMLHSLFISCLVILTLLTYTFLKQVGYLPHIPLYNIRQSIMLVFIMNDNNQMWMCGQPRFLQYHGCFLLTQLK